MNDHCASNEPLESVIHSRRRDSENDELGEDISPTKNNNHMEIYLRGIEEGWVLMIYAFEGL